MAGDVTTATPELSVQRVRLAAPANLLPGARRLKARYRKTSSKHPFELDQHLRTAQAYMLDFKVAPDGKGAPSPTAP
jgi:hypothetical protein